MTDSMLDKYLPRRSENGAGTPHLTDGLAPLGGESSDADDLGCFGWLRGVRDRALMLELRRKDGSILAVSYGYLERAEFDPAVGITLHVMGRTIKITGRNLNGDVGGQGASAAALDPDAAAFAGVRLFQGITRHRVPWVRESGQAERFNGQGEGRGVVVERVEW